MPLPTSAIKPIGFDSENGTGEWKNITKGCISQALVLERLVPIVVGADFATSGVHGRWGNRQRPGRPAFAQKLSAKATQESLGMRLWDRSEKLTGLTA